MNVELLRQKLSDWTSLEAPTGFEEPVLRAAREALTPLCDAG